MFSLFSKAKREPDIEERLVTLERQVRAIQVEWLDTLDRLKTMMGRIVKDRARAEQARAESPEQVHLSDEDVASGQDGLTPNQRAANAKILARRNRMNQ